MRETFNIIRQGDCIAAMNNLPAGIADLIFADPPFNIGYEYDVYEDSVEHQEYINWSIDWISAVYRILKPNGTFWLAIGDEYAAELKLESQKAGFHCRSWVIWYYTFGVNCAKKFTRSHTHLFHFVKDRDNFTFLDENLDNRVPSARELVYNDKRANPNGRLPDDTWIIRPADAAGEFVSDDDETWAPRPLVPPADNDRTYILRPQDLEDSFQPNENTWYFPRVAGTFKERAGFHGCQMPEQLLGRIIRTCTYPKDLVLDPFSGSATTLVVAKKMGRRFLGFDISEAYVQYGIQRLRRVRSGDRLDGSPEPMKSAPRTDRGRHGRRSNRNQQVTSHQDDLSLVEKRNDENLIKITEQGVIEAFRLTHDGFSADRIVADPEINSEFVSACTNLGLPGDARTWNIMLFRLRKRGDLSHIPTLHRTIIPWEECDVYMFASEIAWQIMIDNKSAKSLDEILCDPVLADEFDKTAHRFSPGHKAFHYRWTALKIRKEAMYARSRAKILTPPSRFSKMLALDDLNTRKLPAAPGLYVLSKNQKRTRNLYVGETLDLRSRLILTRKQHKAWLQYADKIFIQTLQMDYSSTGKLDWQSCLANKFNPSLNLDHLYGSRYRRSL